MKTQFLAVLLGATLSLNAFADGGVDGGGGGTLPADPISVADVKQIIRTSKRDLQLVLNYQSMAADRAGDLDPIYDKIFRGPKDIREVMDETDLEIREFKPCYTSDGREVDASIHASRPNTICLSAFLIAPKLVEERARTEILALIAHELTHVLGADEAEARQFQKDVAYALKNFSALQVREYVQTLLSAFQTIGNRFFYTINELETWSDDDFIIKSGDFNDYEVEDALYSKNGQVLLFNARESDYFYYQMNRLRAARMYMSSLSVSSPAGQKAKVTYEKAFGSNTSVTMKDFIIATGKYDHGNRFNHLMFPRLTSKQDLKNELASLMKYFGEESQTASAYFVNDNLRRFERPWSISPHPWLQFLGEYDIISPACATESLDKRKGFKIFMENGQPTLQTIRASGWWNQPLESGIADSSGLVRIEGGTSEAIKISEQGSYWEDYFRTSTVLSEKQNGISISITRDSKTGFNDPIGPVKYESTTCSYQLKKR